MNEMLDKPEIQIGDEVILNVAGVTEIFGNNINALLYGNVTEVYDNIITYQDQATKEVGTCLASYLKKGKPDEDFWYGVASAFRTISEKPFFSEIEEKYPSLVNKYEALTEKFLENSKIVKTIQREYYDRLEKYIFDDALSTFDLSFFKKNIVNCDSLLSDDCETQDIKNGDDVILNDYALAKTFKDKIDKPIWGKVISVLFSNDSKMISFKEPETQEVCTLNISYLKKGLPNKEYVYKILTLISEMEAKKMPGLYDIIRSGSQRLEPLIELRKKYLPTTLEKEKEERKKIIPMFFESQLSKYFEGEILEQKIIEARSNLDLLYEFINNDNNYKGIDMLLLCSYIVKTYEYDNNNKDIRGPLNTNERLAYALAEEFSYNKLASDFVNNNDCEMLYNEFLIQSPIIFNEELVRSAIAMSVDKFREKFSYNGDKKNK